MPTCTISVAAGVYITNHNVSPLTTNQYTDEYNFN
jgi:hypothetical protein